MKCTGVKNEGSDQAAWPAGITSIQGCFCWKEETILKFAGSTGRCLEEQRATSQKKRWERVGWQQQNRMTTAEEHKIQKRACCGPAKTGRKISLCFKVSFVMNMALWFSLFPFFPNGQLGVPGVWHHLTLFGWQETASIPLCYKVCGRV